VSVVVRVDEEVDVSVSAVLSWGIDVHTGDGIAGFVDKLKIPTWLAREEMPKVGEPLTVVVLDEVRAPFRASLLQEDFRRARNARA
jgi:hypothetical protein